MPFLRFAKRCQIVRLTAALILCLVVPPVCADDFYVDAYYGCDETGDGSQDYPWQHLQFALDAIEGTEENPHTVHLAPGHYDYHDNPWEKTLLPGSYIHILGGDVYTTYVYSIAFRYITSSSLSNVSIRSFGGFEAENIFIENCVIIPGETTSMGFQHSEIFLKNCVINRALSILHSANSDVTFTNCIMSNYLTLLDSSSTSDPVISYSMVRYSYPGVGNIVVDDPKFVRPDAFDYRLRADSPAIDKGDPSDPVPPGGGSRIDMGCHEYPYAPVLFIESVIFTEPTGNQNGIPELGETIQPVLRLCNYGEPATDLTITFELDHPDVTMVTPDVAAGMLGFDECHDISGPVFTITGQSGWGLPAELYGDWTDGDHTGRLHIPMTLHGVDFYIDAATGSDDTGDGSPDAPFLTIAHARNRARGSRLHRVTLRPRTGTYSESTNGESWPLWLDEYEDLRGEGGSTRLVNNTVESGHFIAPARTSNLSYFYYGTTITSTCMGIVVNNAESSIYEHLLSDPISENGFGIQIRGSSRLTVRDCKLVGITTSSYEPGDWHLIENSTLEGVSASGNTYIYINNVGPANLGLHQLENSPHGYLPGNIAMHNVITAPTTIKNSNVFTNNICTGVTVTTDVPFEISQNVTTTYMISMESSATATFVNNIGIRTSGIPSFGTIWGTAPSFQNCISLPLIFENSTNNNFSGYYGAFDLDGSIGLFSSTGVDHQYCWKTRNSVLYYLSEDNADCYNTWYSNLINCPEPTNIDEDPGFVGIACITAIGENWFSDSTANWEPDRYAGYYVNPNIYGNTELFYCLGNTSDTVYLWGDPRTVASVGDLFVIPDVRLRRLSDGFTYDSPLINAGDPDVQNPDGSRRDIGAYGGPYALTPMPVIPTWPPPFTATPTPVQSNTPIPTHTPTSPPTTIPSPPTYTPTSIPSGSPTPTPTDPGQTPTDLPTGTPTSTPTPVDQTATPSPTQPDQTPTTSPSHLPSATPSMSPTPLVTGVTITMPAHQYRPGDPCYCTITVTNGDPEPLIDHPLFLILDVYGEYFFAPSFTGDIDYYSGPWPPGTIPVDALPEFMWPDTGTSASGIVWYSALTDPAVTRIVGEWDHFEFSWE